MDKVDEETRKILEKYKKKLAESFDEELKDDSGQFTEKTITSREYKQFKESLKSPHFNFYEKACNICEGILKISPDKKSEKDMWDAIETAHLNVTPTGVSSFAILGPMTFIMLALFFSVGIPYALALEPSMFFLIFSIFAGIILMFPLQKMPFLIANTIRIKASNEMVLAVFYSVTYMRHTSNLELAVEFAANHLTGPLSLDFRKVLWDLETGKYFSIRESLDAYLEGWRKWNLEFVESMQLIEGSLYEGTEERRLSLLDKALDTMLQETYEKMLHYAQDLKSPMTSLNMLGFVLPILGMVMLPLAVNFLGEVKWYYLMTIYNLALPAGVYYMGVNILSSRPSGYGDTDITSNNPQLQGYKVNPLPTSIFIFVVLFMIGISPIIFTTIGGFKNIPIGTGYNELVPDNCYTDEGEPPSYCLFQFRTQETDDGEVEGGPFDLIPSLLSVFIPMSFGLSIGYYYKTKTKKIIEIREKSKSLEGEFSGALFQLGNRLGDGLPAEIAFGKVAKVMGSTTSGEFFNDVHQNITTKGMGVKEALFDQEKGVIYRYPSNIILSSMRVLTEASRKSPQIASQAIISISSYIKEMHRIDERLRDLLSDVISSMKSQSSFLAPVISAVVIGIGSMITNVLGKISLATEQGDMDTGDATAAGVNLDDFFGMGIPTFHFQMIVGLYVIQLIYILTYLVSGIESGSDKLMEEHQIGTNLVKGTILYSMLAFAVILLFNLLADTVISKTLMG
ncbi:MAG: hypothetical protein ACOCZQ_00215 [Nanoarchaeota archaeon]